MTSDSRGASSDATLLAHRRSPSANPDVTPPRPPDPPSELRRRLTYLMLFRVALITLVLGATTLLYWLSNANLRAFNAVGLYAIIGATYLLTIVYALILRAAPDPARLAAVQLAIDLVIASLLMHMTGGAQSAYTFFFPLTVIGAATVSSRNTTAWVAGAAAFLFVGVALLGWAGVLPPLPGQELRPRDLTAIELVRAMGLNMAAIIGVAVLALALSSQLARTSATLAVERRTAADLLSLHSDIVRCLSSGLVTVDQDDLILTINQFACEILDTEAAQVVGEPVARVLPGLPERWTDLGHGSIARSELELPRAGRPTLVMGVSVSPLFDHGGRFLGRVVNFQDLTDLRKMELSVKQQERLAVLGRLAAGVAHEIRNPLASISGSIELLGQMPQADDESRALMNIVTREIDRLNGLLTDLLDYANPRPLKVAPLDLRELLRDTVRVFEQDRGLGDVAVSLDAAGEVLPLEGDAAKLRQVLWNLLRNAAEAATQGGGTVSVEIEVEPGAATVAIRVRDDGPGIPPAQQPQVFEPFFTTKNRGSGLGLATVHSLVTDHRGTVDFESEVGRGTCFTVRLPLTGAHRSQPHAAQPEPGTEPSSPTTEETSSP